MGRSETSEKALTGLYLVYTPKRTQDKGRRDGGATRVGVSVLLYCCVCTSTRVALVSSHSRCSLALSTYKSYLGFELLMMRMMARPVETRCVRRSKSATRWNLLP